MYSSMQISNSSLSQFVSSTVNLNQQGNKPFAGPVTIEGQIIDDEKTESTDKQTVNSVLDRPENESQTQLIQSPPITQVPIPGNFSNALLSREKSQQLLQNNSGITPTPSFISQNEPSARNEPLARNEPSARKEPSAITNNFPYANRRSFAGLAGSSLVIQKYLNNESPAPEQSGQIQRSMNFFI